MGCIAALIFKIISVLMVLFGISLLAAADMGSQFLGIALIVMGVAFFLVPTSDNGKYRK